MSWKFAEPPAYGGPTCPSDGLTLSVRPSPRPRTRTPGGICLYIVLSVGDALLAKLGWRTRHEVTPGLLVAWGQSEHRGKVMIEPARGQQRSLRLRPPPRMRMAVRNACRTSPYNSFDGTVFAVHWDAAAGDDDPLVGVAYLALPGLPTETLRWSLLALVEPALAEAA